MIIRIMNYWHINTGSLNNKNHMMQRNMCYIGLGKDSNEYHERLKKNKNTTPYQFDTFQTKAKVGDKILLYHNGQGYIAYGIYTGRITEPVLGIDIAPDWERTEIQKHIHVKQWIPIKHPTMKYSQRKTLVRLKKGSEILLK